VKRGVGGWEWMELMFVDFYEKREQGYVSVLVIIT
jgi:hypothetical protein